MTLSWLTTHIGFLRILKVIMIRHNFINLKVCFKQRHFVHWVFSTRLQIVRFWSDYRYFSYYSSSFPCFQSRNTILSLHWALNLIVISLALPCWREGKTSANENCIERMLSKQIDTRVLTTDTWLFL